MDEDEAKCGESGALVALLWFCLCVGRLSSVARRAGRGGGEARA